MHAARTYELPGDILSVVPLRHPLAVLIDGRLFQIREEGAREVGDLGDLVKCTARCGDKVFAATSSAIYEIDEGKIKTLHSIDLPEASVMAVTDEVIVIGAHTGKVLVLAKDRDYVYSVHEDSIVDIVILQTYIYTASEDGIITRSRIYDTEPREAYGIKQVLKYMGKYNDDLIIVDAQGSTYTFDKDLKDLKRNKKVFPKPRLIHPAGSSDVYAQCKNGVFRLVKADQTQRENLPALRIDGVFTYNNELYYHQNGFISPWNLPRKPDELAEFFEDL